MQRETKWWTWHILTGGIILVLLTLHMLIMHMDIIFGFFSPFEGRAIQWENVFIRSKSILFSILYVVLLGSALYHGLYGLRTILFELMGSLTLQRIITISVWLIGSLLFFIGSWAAATMPLFH